jgi:hypothetical protein
VSGSELIIVEDLREIFWQNLPPSVDRTPQWTDHTPTSEPLPGKILEAASFGIEDMQFTGGMALDSART